MAIRKEEKEVGGNDRTEGDGKTAFIHSLNLLVLFKLKDSLVPIYISTPGFNCRSAVTTTLRTPPSLPFTFVTTPRHTIFTILTIHRRNLPQSRSPTCQASVPTADHFLVVYKQNVDRRTILVLPVLSTLIWAATGNSLTAAALPETYLQLHLQAVVTYVTHNLLHPTVPSMDIIPPQISSCSREHQKIYQEWFAFADSVAPPSQVSSVQWFNSKSTKKIPLSSVTSIIDGLKRLYIEKLKPLEVSYRFNDFVSPLLTNSDFDAKPMVMLLGQYSTGKTTFIKHLLRTSYPGAHIGPEPTTDRFVVVMSGPDERSIPGNTIAVQADMPYSGLTSFGTAFLSKFECSQMPHPLLEHITFVDTPGVLSGEKQRTQRSYDFTGVTSWFAAKCDLILLYLILINLISVMSSSVLLVLCVDMMIKYVWFSTRQIK
ncbi:hypothetical protein HPP92_026420 [Vanilla planifolia]|uniref:Dynamin-type G domain-containing protein n=1 Tax=Vanilla planifolia TaxID=51239 RepID=A0A835U836_VANPL|nr:hypothetical protein HPP92_026420 [Vanilla planifolia]